MTASKAIETEQIFAHVRRAENSIANFHRDGTRRDGVLRNPKQQTTALKLAREARSKAIAMFTKSSVKLSPGGICCSWPVTSMALA
jgi:hypothetical protein